MFNSYNRKSSHQITPALNPYSLINASTINGLPAFLFAHLIFTKIFIMSRNGLCIPAIIHPVIRPSLNYYHEKTASNFLHGKILDVQSLFIKLLRNDSKSISDKENLKYVDYKHRIECVRECVELVESDMLPGSLSILSY